MVATREKWPGRFRLEGKAAITSGTQESCNLVLRSLWHYLQAQIYLKNNKVKSKNIPPGQRSPGGKKVSVDRNYTLKECEQWNCFKSNVEQTSKRPEPPCSHQCRHTLNKLSKYIDR